MQAIIMARSRVIQQSVYERLSTYPLLYDGLDVGERAKEWDRGVELNATKRCGSLAALHDLE
jgi:hypothetical protein